ncbi:MAG: diaminopimelate epimerase [Bacillota bacterium]|nr:diaminopimelate epimerase [Bacillota bacterium]
MIRFSKYHGCGNNFVMVRECEIAEDGRYAAKGNVRESEYARFAQEVCDINTGIGADGLIIVREEPELEMVFYNMDGSRAPMCGNGIRCFAYYCMNEGIRSEKSYAVKTLAGDMIVEVASEEPFMAKINMGKPIFDPAAIAVKTDREDFLKQELELSDGSSWTVNSLFMGTVHTVVFVDDYEAFDIVKVGKEICEHPTYTEKTNVNFVKVIDEKTVEMKTYERGVGMTLACGTGACATAVVANMQGLCKSPTEVILQLGSLNIELKDDGNVFMEGPSVKIAEGKFL